MTDLADLNDVLAVALDAEANRFAEGFRPGHIDPDAECPWHMGEMQWPEWAPAIRVAFERYLTTKISEIADEIHRRNMPTWGDGHDPSYSCPCWHEAAIRVVAQLYKPDILT